MTAASTADRIVADGTLPTDLFGKGNEELRERLRNRDLPVIVADNVADYVRRRDRPYVIGEFPCLAPTWDWAFFEYPSRSGKQRRGVYLLAFDLLNDEVDEEGLRGMIGEALADARRQSPDAEPRWAVVLVAFVDDGHHVSGPHGVLIYVADGDGKDLGNRWFLPNKAEAGEDGRLWQPTSEWDADWLFAATLPVLQTIAFSHCRNVAIESGARPEKLARKYRRRHGVEPLRWKTVRLELPRRGPSEAARGPGTGSPSLHIVAGHFSHYGDCCLADHEPKGKLFGRLEGVYWMAQHLRGSAETGEVRADRVVALGEVR